MKPDKKPELTIEERVERHLAEADELRQVLKTLLGRVEFPFGVAGSEFLAPSVTYTNG